MAKYIVADRDPFFVAQSLLFARKKFHGNYDTWWSIMPKNYNELLRKTFIQQVVLQHYYINKQMYEDLNQLVSLKGYITVVYAKLSEEKDDYLNKIKSLINDVNYRAKFINNEIHESKKIKLPRKIIVEIEKEVSRLDWHDYKS